jgi:phospholipid-translocating ATPase
VIALKDDKGTLADSIQGASLDEVTFLEMARETGFVKFVKREETNESTDKITIEVQGKQEIYEILKVIEFTSARKRMSVIVKNEAGQVINFIKGADETMMKRTTTFTDSSTVDLGDKQAELGLRTLMFGFKNINSDGPSFDELRDTSQEILERTYEEDIEFLGITALEDILQEGVAGCIEDFKNAAIKVWMLTGDKKETAINIGISSSIICDSHQLFNIEGLNIGELQTEMKKIEAEIKQTNADDDPVINHDDSAKTGTVAEVKTEEEKTLLI